MSCIDGKDHEWEFVGVYKVDKVFSEGNAVVIRVWCEFKCRKCGITRSKAFYKAFEVPTKP